MRFSLGCDRAVRLEGAIDFTRAQESRTRQRVKDAIEMGCAKGVLVYVKGAVAGEYDLGDL